MRLKILTVAVLALVTVFPYQAFADKQLEPVHSLTFADVEPLMLARYQAILDNTKSYNDANQGQSNVAESTDDLDSLILQAHSIGDAGDPLGYVLEGLLKAQNKAVSGVTSMTTTTNISAMGVQVEQGNMSLVWQKQAQFIAYNNLVQDLAKTQETESLLEKKLEATKLQQQLGMATDSDVKSAQSDLTAAQAGIKQLEDGIASLKQMFNVALAQPYDTELAIGSVPEVTDDDIAAINVDNDYTEALKKAYGVKIADINKDNDKKNDAIRQFENGFKLAYQAIIDKQKALETEQAKMTVADNNMTTADLKFKLGMLSSLQYEVEKNNYTTERTAYIEAKNALFQAYQQYQWAKRGLIIAS